MLAIYADENPNGLSSDELDIIRSWNNLITRDVYAYKHTKDYTLFAGEDNIFAVEPLYQPFKVLFSNLPAMCQIAIMPFRDKMTIDGIITSKNIYSLQVV